MARGENRSRPMDDLVREAQALAEHHAEIVITGIHIGSYGLDAGSSLGELMTRLVRDVPAVRFRLSSIEATEIDHSLRELIVGEPLRVAPHIHAPLQSGSDRLLKRMGRNWYTSATYSAALENLSAKTPVLGLGADIITGFPGETEDDHQATVRLVEALPFTYLHVFPYSVRPGTPAERLADRVDGVTSARRAAELRTIGERKAAAYRASRAGGRADLIVLGDGMTAMSGDYLDVELATRQPRGERFNATLISRLSSLVALPD
jgi:threonylcarbamoyladenosine tRNA methylthiotransferase MtaB